MGTLYAILFSQITCYGNTIFKLTVNAYAINLLDVTYVHL